LSWFVGQAVRLASMRIADSWPRPHRRRGARGARRLRSGLSKPPDDWIRSDSGGAALAESSDDRLRLRAKTAFSQREAFGIKVLPREEILLVGP
jgi:hypothetical protein